MLPGACIPEANGFIPAGGDQKLPLGVDGDAADSMFVACQGHDLLAAGDTPEFDRFVATSGNDPFAVWREDKIVYRVEVPSANMFYFLFDKKPR